MLAEGTISSSTIMTGIAMVACTLSVCGVAWTAGRWRGNFDGLAQRVDTFESITSDVYNRLGEIDKNIVSLTEQVSFIKDRGNAMPRVRDPPKVGADRE